MAHPRTNIYRSADLYADAARLEVRRDGIRLDLEPKALRVLFHLIENRDRVVTKEELFTAVWSGVIVTDNALTRVIAQLRKQLRDDARLPRYIETIATTGYRYIADVQLPEVVAEAPIDIARAASDATRTRFTAHIWRRLLVFMAVFSMLALGWWLRDNSGTPRGRLSGMRQITNSLAADFSPTFSPDGSQIAFTSDRTGHREIYVRSLAPGGVERQITFDGQDNGDPSWSPDGQHLAYAAKLRGGIGLIPVSGGPTHYLSDSGDQPQWSPDGRTLVCRIPSRNPVFGRHSAFDSTLMLLALDGTPPRPLTYSGNHPGATTIPNGFPMAAPSCSAHSRQNPPLSPEAWRDPAKPGLSIQEPESCSPSTSLRLTSETQHSRRIAGRSTSWEATNNLGFGESILGETGAPIRPKQSCPPAAWSRAVSPSAPTEPASR